MSETELEKAQRELAQAQARLAELQAQVDGVKASEVAPPAAEGADAAAGAADAAATDLAEPSAPPAVVEAPPASAPGDLPEGPLAEETVQGIQQAYAFQGEALEIGALVNGEARPDVQVRIPLGMLNRHGLVAGATGTGKTKTLQVLAEQLSARGVPVFAADIKGDLSGIASEGQPNEKLVARTQKIGQDWQPKGFPTELFSLGGRGTGIPIRATITAFGPLMLSKVLGLNQTQESSLALVFAYADQRGLPLIDLKDLREVLLYLTGDEGKGELREIGGISPATAGVILREITAFAASGADVFFGEPEFEIADVIRTTSDGRGIVSLLQVPGVANEPALFSTFLMWMLGELFETLPEVGDPEKPRLVFFFDEAHLLFRDASKNFLQAITQTVRLIRSKGVGVFFVTQTPKDVPGDVLAQLGSRVQHALRAHTPDDAKALKAAVRTFPNTEYDLEEVLTTLGTGEAIVTVMNEKGAPSPVAWTRVRAPEGSMDPSPQQLLDSIVANSPLALKYGEVVDRESAYEILQARLVAAEEARQKAEDEEAARKAALEREREAARLEREAAKQRAEAERAAKSQNRSSGRSKNSGNPIADALNSRTGQTVVREVLRGILGNRRR